MDVKVFDAQLIIWDDANVNFNFNFKLSLAHVQRLTYSSYYGGNCAKCGVHFQCCGQIRVWYLWTGGVSDSECLISSNNEEEMSVIEKNSCSKKKDLVNGGIKSFCNTLDKGCRVTQHILCNFQTVIQSLFSKDKKNFKGIDGLCISEVA